MEIVTTRVEDHTRPAATAAKLHAMAMAICPVLLARNPAKSAATIRNAASYVMSLAYRVLRTVPGLAHTADGVHYHVRYPVTYFHAPSAVQRRWLVGINVRPFAGRSVQLLRIVRFVRIQQSRG